MPQFKITKLSRVENTDIELLEEGIVAFQLIKIEYEFYGAKKVDFLDTKIMQDGRQIVIDGNGFIKHDTEIL